jgi:NAD(P)-dependent dehydrogenase (short-subunit alcohol dehydrogenase family)
MNPFKDKVAIVTGGASGIGRAICQALGRREAAAVIVADINTAGARQTAAAITAAGGRADTADLDVSLAEAVQNLVDETVSAHGRLDYMFNNAGIGIVGDARDMALEHWRHLLDINLWGVIYGTTSAYQVMVKQGFGHIVNTASAGGLFPLPLATAYATSKYGIVGLSTSLRIEAAELGVKVSVVCPGGVQTGIIDSVTLLKINRAEALSKFPASLFMDAGKCADVVLRGVARNKAIIMVTAYAHLGWWFYRLFPGLATALSGKMAHRLRALRREY